MFVLRLGGAPLGWSAAILIYRAAVALAVIALTTWPALATNTLEHQGAHTGSGADALAGTWDIVVGDQTGAGRFDGPTGIAVGSDGSVYVADTRNHRVQKLSSTGEPLAQWGGEGDGPGQLRAPVGLAVGADGALYVSDSERHDVQHLSPTGEPLARWGGEGTELGRFRATGNRRYLRRRAEGRAGQR